MILQSVHDASKEREFDTKKNDTAEAMSLVRVVDSKYVQ